MKKIGLVGGIGPASTVDYYLGLIERCRTKLGETVYPEIVIDSVNLHEATEYVAKNEMRNSVNLMLYSLKNLKAAGAQIAAITANTEHIYWDEMKENFPLPVISIVDSVVAKIQKEYQRVLVIGTVFTMASGLYNAPLSKAGVTAISPNEEDMKIIGDIIYPNLENGIIIPEDKQVLLSLCESYIKRENADSVLLGCTELALMIKSNDLSVPVLDSTQIHIDKIFSLANTQI